MLCDKIFPDPNFEIMAEPTDPNAQDPQTQGQPTPPNPPQPSAPPAGGQAGGQGDQAQGAQPPAGQAGAKQQDLSGIMEENVDISALVANAGNQQQIQDFITSVTIPPHPNTTFDEKKFIELLAGSISLTITEKKRIIESIPKLSQFQIDELMKIFDEEKAKFSELEKKHADQIKELEEKHKSSWQDLEAQKQEESKKKKEEQEAEDIKKQLGL